MIKIACYLVDVVNHEKFKQNEKVVERYPKQNRIKGDGVEGGSYHTLHCTYTFMKTILRPTS